MGCSNSVPVAASEDAGVKGKDVTHGANMTASSGGKGANSTRSRRLSVIVAEPQSVPPVGNGAVDEVRATMTKSRSARARRLSHITHNADDSMIPVDDVNLDDPEGLPTPIGTTACESMRVSVACMSRAGKEPGFKKTNQDSCFAFEKYISEDQALFGAMDGHGPQGHLVSGFVKQHLPIMLVHHLATGGPDVCAALTKGFLEVDASLGASRIECEYSGSTTVVAFLKGKTLTTAWVGDSRGVVGIQEAGSPLVVAQDLTIDHKPTDPVEMERILGAKGRVERLVDETGEPMGPHRVWLQSAWIPGLAMSRALGDAVAHSVGVSSEPQHSVTELNETHKFMILASDGVWEFVSSQEAVDIIASHDNIEDACRSLVEEAHQRWLVEEDGVVDDITAVVVRFLH
ncbi:hypothetical protein FOA52_006780 [Chlamydomonas sp. UWO 241]|nr:hypothetical protein FOA52_006780 [Chlamydomonas sp. UWO 241]